MTQARNRWVRSGRTDPLRRVLVPMLLLMAAFFPDRPALAQNVPNRIFEIQIEGTRQVETGQIVGGIASRVGGPLDPDLIARDLRSLFAMGFFADVKLEAEEVPERGYRLIFTVTERPRITVLRIAGNTLVSTKDLTEKLSVKVGSFYAPSAVEQMLDAIRRLYREKGYFKVNLTTKVDRLNPAEYGLTVTIEESPRIYITEIHVKGATVLSELEIKRIMLSAEVDCFDWANSSGVFDEDKINADLQVITTEYASRGYIRVFIDKPEISLVKNPEFARIVVKMQIAEGAQYFTGKFDIGGDIVGDKKELLDQIRLVTGKPFNPQIQNQDQFRLAETYQEQGYAFVQVVPDRRVNDETHIVDVTYNILSGDKAYIGRIEFQGNRETRDFVMRREFQVREDELYNGRKLRESQENLRALVYFKPGTALDQQPGDVANILDIVTKVEEAQTGTLQGQVGFSDVSGLIVAASVSKGNLGGRGQTLRFSSEFAQKNVRRNFSVDFIEPHLFDTDYSSDSAVSYLNRDDLSELRRGLITEFTFSEGVGYRLLPRLTLSFSFDATNRVFKKSDFQPLQLRGLSTALTYRTVNNPVFPSDGSLVSAGMTQYGGQVLQGTTEYRRYRFSAQRFIALNSTSSAVLMGRMFMAWLEAVGNNEIPIEDRFRIGGISTLRGYNFFEVGGPMGTRERNLNSERTISIDPNGQPVLDGNGDPVVTLIDKRTIGLSEAEREKLIGGGIQQRVFNLELLFPLAGDNVRGVIFYDAGNVNAEREQYRILNEKEPAFLELLSSYGAGIRLISPLGVLRFEYGIKINPAKSESPSRFDFTISTLF
jgi:outer membrane protein insertion porin family